MVAAVVSAVERLHRAGKRVREANQTADAPVIPPTSTTLNERSQEVQVHLHKVAWRHILSAVALVTFALPLAAPLATTANAQVGDTGTPPPSSIGTIVSAAPAIAFNPIGSSHTVLFTCGPGTASLTGSTPLTGTGATGSNPPGCWNVQ